jgi:hypothetical protein
MISRNVKIYCCEDPSLIENYELALNDTVNVWDCHHKLEIHSDYRNTPEELKMMGLYYNRPACEFIFLKKDLHTSTHQSGVKKSATHKMNLSKAKTGSHNKVKRKPLTEAQKNNISSGTKKAMNDSKLRKHLSDKAKARVALNPIPNANWKKGKHKVVNQDGSISWV